MEEELMYCTNSCIGIFIFNYCAYTAFTWSLGNCKNIYILTRKCIKEFSCNTTVSNHSIADNTYNGTILAYFYRVNKLFADFQFKLSFYRILYGICFCIADTERNCIFTWRLSNQKNWWTGSRNSRENLTCHSCPTPHKGTANTYHRNMLKRRNTADAGLSMTAFEWSLAYTGSAGTWIMTVETPGFYALCL